MTTYGTLYSTDAGHTAVVSSLIICNTGAVDTTFRIGFDTTAGSPSVANGEFIVYGATVQANDTITMDIGMTLGASLYLRCSAGATDVNFVASVAEIS